MKEEEEDFRCIAIWALALPLLFSFVKQNYSRCIHTYPLRTHWINTVAPGALKALRYCLLYLCILACTDIHSGMIPVMLYYCRGVIAISR
jgi:hypothetical protein